MELEKIKANIEAMLFASGKQVSNKNLIDILQINKSDFDEAIKGLKEEYSNTNRGIQLIEVDDGVQLCTKEDFYDNVVALLDNRPKPSLSQAAMETLAIIAYNPKITRAEIERIRGVSSDSAVNKLIEYNLIEEAGRIDAPGRPMSFKTSDEFLRLFGYNSLKDMPELPKLKEEDMQMQIEAMNEDKEKDSSTKSTEDSSQEENLEDNAQEIAREDSYTNG